MNESVQRFVGIKGPQRGKGIHRNVAPQMRRSFDNDVWVLLKHCFSRHEGGFNHLRINEDPIEYCTKLVENLTTRVIEYPSDAPEFEDLRDQNLRSLELEGGAALQQRLRSPASVLDVSDFFRKKFLELELYTIGEVLEADEATFVRARQVGKVRARQMKIAAANAVLEYLSG